MIKWESRLAAFGTRKHHYLIRGQFALNAVITGSTFVPPSGGGGVIGFIDETGQGLDSLIDDNGQGLNSNITASLSLISFVDETGQGLNSLIDDTGQGVESL